MKKKLFAIAKRLGFLAKLQGKTATPEDFNAFAAACKTELDIDIEAAIAALKNPEETVSAEQQAILTALFGEGSTPAPTPDTAPAAAPSAAQSTASAPAPAQPAQPQATADVTAQILAGIQDMQGRIRTLEGSPESSAPASTIPAQSPQGGKNMVAINCRVHNATHLFSIDNDFYALSHPWNQVAATRQPQIAKDKRKQAAFKVAFNDYAQNFAQRLGDITASGQIADLKMEAFDYSGFDGTGWGEQYLVRRQDALISYLRSLPSVRKVFPVIYGVQDKMEMTNSFLTDFSQAFQAGRVFKGKHSVQPMLAEVYDVMYKHLFEDMKKLEREYIGYLNREASQPIKWSFIEWLMMRTLEKLNNEWNERRIRGYRIDPTTGEAGHHLFGSNGVIRQLWKYAEELYILPFSDLKIYTNSTILTYVETLVERVNQLVPSLSGLELNMNEKHVPWFLEKYREKYGTDLDFDGEKMEVKNYSSFGGIKVVPNMGNSCMMWITPPDNIELYEDAPGEMSAIYFERELESLISASWWKEGVGAYLVGKKYATLAELEASNYAFQFIFMTNPVVDLDADATTADATLCDRFVTGVNTAEKTFTDFVGKSEGVVYRLELGDVTFVTKTAKADLFADIDAWVPTAIGDYLEVYWDSENSKYVEVRRQVTA
jgi:hypothetical protein